jgi:hypothetical protein
MRAYEATGEGSALRAFGVGLFDRWTAMWNGDLELAPQILAERFTLRYTQQGSELFDRVHCADDLTLAIRKWHEVRPGIRFAAEGEAAVDLLREADGPVGRVARPYLATFPDPASHTIARSGIDMLRVERGRIVEVWSVSSGPAGRTFYRAN